MTIGVVSGQYIGFGDYTGTTYTTKSVSLPASWRAGNGLIVSQAWDYSPGATVTTSSGTSTFEDGPATDDATSTRRKRFSGCKELTGTPTATVTTTYSVATGYVVTEAQEITNQNVGTLFDVTPVGQKQSALALGTDAISSGNITPSTDGCLIYGSTISTLNLQLTASGGIAAGTGYSGNTSVISGSTHVGKTESKVQTTAAAVAATFTPSVAADTFLTQVCAIRPARFDFRNAPVGGYDSASPGTTTVTPTAAAQNGDLIRVFLVDGPSNANEYATISPPSGFALLTSLAVGGYGKLYLYEKTAGSSEPSSYDFTATVFTPVDIAWGIVILKNWKAGGAAAVTQGNGTSSPTVNIPGITALGKSKVFAVVGSDSTDVGITGGLSSWGDAYQEIIDVQDVSSGWTAVGAAYKNNYAADAVAATTVTQADNNRSNVVVFEVLGKFLEVTAQPTEQVAADGATATFTVTATAGFGSLSYQWQRQDPLGGSWSNVGTNSNSYTTGTLSRATDAGAQYRVVVSDTDETVTSNAANLRVTAIPTSYGSSVGLVVGSSLSFVGASYVGSSDAGSGQSVSIGLNSETDTAQSMGKSKSKALGLNTETDTAQALAHTKSKAVGLNTESDSAFALTFIKAKALGLNTEADSAQAMGKSKAVAIGLAIETDSALALTHALSRTLGLTSEVDSAFTLTFTKAKALGLNTEADTAQPMGSSKSAALGLALETDSAQAITHVRSFAFAINSETDTAQPIGRSKSAALGLNTESDSAFALIFTKAKALGLNVETDTVQPMGRNKSLALGLNVETDSAFEVTPEHGTAVALGQAQETDSAFSITHAKVKGIGLNLETDTAQPVGRRKSAALGLNTEMDTAQAFAHTKSKAVGLALESDSVFAVQVIGGTVDIELDALEPADQADFDLHAERKRVTLRGVPISNRRPVFTLLPVNAAFDATEASDAAHFEVAVGPPPLRADLGGMEPADAALVSAALLRSFAAAATEAPDQPALGLELDWSEDDAQVLKLVADHFADLERWQ